jgi:hypothetical protein
MRCMVLAAPQVPHCDVKRALLCMHYIPLLCTNPKDAAWLRMLRLAREGGLLHCAAPNVSNPHVRGGTAD